MDDDTRVALRQLTSALIETNELILHITDKVAVLHGYGGAHLSSASRGALEEDIGRLKTSFLGSLARLRVLQEQL